MKIKFLKDTLVIKCVRGGFAGVEDYSIVSIKGGEWISVNDVCGLNIWLSGNTNVLDGYNTYLINVPESLYIVKTKEDIEPFDMWLGTEYSFKKLTNYVLQRLDINVVEHSTKKTQLIEHSVDWLNNYNLDLDIINRGIDMLIEGFSKKSTGLHKCYGLTCDAYKGSRRTSLILAGVFDD